MPRPVDPDGKSNRLVLAPRVDQLVRVKAFREICARNKLSINDELMKRVDEFLREHHWPPGNSQILMKEFLPGGPAEEKPVQCHFCEQPSVGIAVYQGRRRWPVCTRHKEEVSQNPKWIVEA